MILCSLGVQLIVSCITFVKRQPKIIIEQIINNSSFRLSALVLAFAELFIRLTKHTPVKLAVNNRNKRAAFFFNQSKDGTKLKQPWLRLRAFSRS